MLVIEVEYKIIGDTEKPVMSLSYKQKVMVPDQSIRLGLKGEYTEVMKITADRFWDSVVLMGALE